MGTGIERDLAAFERGDLSREALEAMHGRAVGPVVDAYERMRSLGSVPVGDADAGWAGLRGRLDAEQLTGSVIESASSDRLGAKAAGGSRRGVRSKRTVVLFLAATLMLGGSAFASTGGFGLMNGDDAVPVEPVAGRGESSGVDHGPGGSDQAGDDGQGNDGQSHGEESGDDGGDRGEDAEDGGADPGDDGGEPSDDDADQSDESSGEGDGSGEGEGSGGDGGDEGGQSD